MRCIGVMGASFGVITLKCMMGMNFDNCYIYLSLPVLQTAD